jgi:hypothetical protein
MEKKHGGIYVNKRTLSLSYLLWKIITRTPPTQLYPFDFLLYGFIFRSVFARLSLLTNFSFFWLITGKKLMVSQIQNTITLLVHCRIQEIDGFIVGFINRLMVKSIFSCASFIDISCFSPLSDFSFNFIIVASFNFSIEVLVFQIRISFLLFLFVLFFSR